MDQLAKNILKHSEDKTFSALAEHLQNNSELLARQDSQSLDNLIEALDVSQQSLGVLAILCAKVHLSSVGEFQLLLDQVTTFTTFYDGEQISYARVTFASLYHQFTKVAVKQGKALCAINVLKMAIDKYRTAPTKLTSLHADLVQLCLAAKCVRPVLPYLDQDVDDFILEGSSSESSEHIVRYYYYGGLVYTLVRNYQRAVLFFTVCLSTPASAISAIMLEAYKKYVLVSLLKQGKVSALPKYTSHVVDRYVKPLCGMYNEIAKVYSSYEVSKVTAVIDKYAEPLTRDNNLGLAKRVLASLYHRNVQKLTKTFLTLSLSDMTSRLKLQDVRQAEKYTLEMIESKEIFATIDHSNGMVSFHDNPEKYNGPLMADYIDEEMRKCIEIEKKLASFDQQIAVDQKFIQRMLGGSSTYEDDSFYTDEGLM
ncbi:COP9 signalosome complex subunit 3-like [Dysidea avara]|uniref:COP9 signalosome complex subunit 3-like n=1 Tax=Dysidea avara TaxID=196820 RepID=UPI00332C23A4